MRFLKGIGWHSGSQNRVHKSGEIFSEMNVLDNILLTYFCTGYKHLLEEEIGVVVQYLLKYFAFFAATGMQL